MAGDPERPTSVRIGTLAITPRALADYEDMFLLTEDELAGPILDCPGGASPFGRQVRARGGSVVSVDPAYRLDRLALGERVRRDADHIASWAASNPDGFDWSYLGSPSALARYFRLATDLFLDDYQPAGPHYVAAALPELPFADAQFRMSLCSHLLFCYPEYLTYDDHLAGVLELMRVSRDELRIYPIVDTAGTRYPWLDELRAELDDRGVTTGVVSVPGTWVKGGANMLRCRSA